MIARPARFRKFNLIIKGNRLKTLPSAHSYLLLLLRPLLIHLDHLLELADIVIRPFLHILE